MLGPARWRQNRTMREIRLQGCNTSTVSYYLQGLGVFKALSEQTDYKVYAKWKHDDLYICIDTKQDRQELENKIVEFFHKHYRPVPIVTPWNGGGGFFDTGKDDKAGSAVKHIEKSKLERLSAYRKVIQETRKALKSIAIPIGIKVNDSGGITDKEGFKKSMKKHKFRLIKELRNRLPDEAVSTLDMLCMVAYEKPSYNPLLGSGGNDGNLEFVNNYMQNIGCVFEKDEEKSEELIRSVLFGENANLDESGIGQFYPGASLGPNTTATDIDGTSIVNPWGYILMMEGAVFFSGGVAKSLSEQSMTHVTFPFVVGSTLAGYGTSADEKTKGEIWVPTWSEPASFAEIKHVFSEGKARLGDRQANSGAEFARSIIGLGTERGLDAFYRFGVLKRNGDSHFILPLGRIVVREDNAKEAELLFQIDKWLGNIKGIKRKPANLDRMIKNLENSIFDFAATGKREHLQKILTSVGMLELGIPISCRDKVYPIKGLDTKWVDLCYDDTAEFRIATSLASIGIRSNAIRTNIEPVKASGERTAWDGRSNSVVPYRSSREYVSRILDRRIIDSMKDKTTEQRHNRSVRKWLDTLISVPVQDMVDLLDDKIDMEKIAALFIALSLVEYGKEYRPSWENDRSVWEYKANKITYQFAVLKIVFMLEKYDNKDIQFESSVLSLLNAGRFEEAFHIAQRRLVVSGFMPFLYGNNYVRAMPHRNIHNIKVALMLQLSYEDQEILISKALKSKISMQNAVTK